MPAVPFSALPLGETGDTFVLLATREAAKTRDGKPYFRVSFRDRQRTATAMVWSDSPWFPCCNDEWVVGAFYKIRGRVYETNWGLQVDIERIRDVTDDDRGDGFDPADFVGHTRWDPQDLLAELRAVAEDSLQKEPIRDLVLLILDRHAEQIARWPAASRNHHAFVGGYVEHVLSVTRTAEFLAAKYAALYPHLHPPLSTDLVIAGAILHDIGKLAELATDGLQTGYTAAGRLIGHIVLGRDVVRDAAREIPELDPEDLLRLEHIILSHQNLPEWGSPVSPHTPEALLVHYADDIDAKFQMMAEVLSEPDDEEFSSRQNPLRRHIFRGLRGEETRESREK